MIDKWQPKILPKRTNFRRYDSLILNAYNLKTIVHDILGLEFLSQYNFILFHIISNLSLNIVTVFTRHPVCFYNVIYTYINYVI